MSGQGNLDRRLEELMRPFWRSQLMRDEAVVPLAEAGEPGQARLLFRPQRILSVRNAALDREYREGEDWIYENGRLKLTARSAAPALTLGALYPPEAKEGDTVPKIGGGHLLTNKQLLQRHQLAVTYTHAPGEWTGPVPVPAEAGLSRTLVKLRRGGQVKICLYGDSIAAGCDSSGVLELPPYQPDWGSLLIGKLRRAYRSAEIQFCNPSVGGKTAQWGLANAAELVAVHRPDLVLVAFGMNDGTERAAPDTFRERIAGILERLRAAGPETEFLLISPMLPNPLAALPEDPGTSFMGEQRNYRPVLEELAAAGRGIALMDMTSVHEELLRRKPYWDLSGNHINHPNDFLSRWYAQVAAGLLAWDGLQDI